MGRQIDPHREHGAAVLEEPATSADLLISWREATRAAELTERLAAVAAATLADAELNAAAAQEVADLADRAATSAIEAAEHARRASDEARRAARTLREADTAEREADTAERSPTWHGTIPRDEIYERGEIGPASRG